MSSNNSFNLPEGEYEIRLSNGSQIIYDLRNATYIDPTPKYIDTPLWRKLEGIEDANKTR